MARNNRHRNDRAKSLVGFTVGGLRYAVEILRVREIINPLSVVLLPQAPSCVLGLADHRGEVIPVLSLRARLGLSGVDDPRRRKWVIVSVDDRSVGWVVDSVTDVFGTSAEEERQLPEVGNGSQDGISRVFSTADGLTFLLDVDRVSEPTSSIELPHEGFV